MEVSALSRKCTQNWSGSIDKIASKGAGAEGGIRGSAPLLLFSGRGRVGKCAFFKNKIVLNAVIFYLKRKEDVEY